MIRRLASALVDAARGRPMRLRSREWPRVRRAHLEREPTCQGCGGTDLLEVHHIVPFHLDRSLELVASNLITLCDGKSYSCHHVLGHFCNWHSWNRDVVKDAEDHLETVRMANHLKAVVAL